MKIDQLELFPDPLEGILKNAAANFGRPDRIFMSAQNYINFLMVCQNYTREEAENMVKKLEDSND